MSRDANIKSIKNIKHEPVLLAEILELLAPSAGKVVVDCTIGFAGHSVAMLERVGSQGFLLGIDLDALALKEARHRLTVLGDNPDAFFLAMYL